MSEQEEREQKRREYRALLEGFWPDAFNFSRPRPLKVGILAELIADAEQRGLPFDSELLTSAIKFYTRRYVYQRALTTMKERTGLDGQIAGEVTPKQREYSLKLIRRFAAKDKAEKRARQEEKAAKQSGINPGA
ncbi:ProQ/FINO family protein [Escherichia coli]|uniref:ProQ/FINO family protein n=1 Tax=Escherichia coli TaxID=562 RepID=UPI00068DD413|nr:ProQ/FINO family protein [Escherichia coli]EDL1342418.1 hypothetical protein [Salmonella enterica subsp. enterica serovar Typhimurium]EHW6813005.1 hypothetical protein [Salmonella enterica subsp. enterica serovar Typhi]HBC2942089.1 hypothetical protein [Escherichia coli O146]HDE7527599.1 hypothetical protein [Staphylococcus aureus]HDQ6716268.1 hypothetical protein [Escherichia coli O113:H4]